MNILVHTNRTTDTDRDLLTNIMAAMHAFKLDFNNYPDKLVLAGEVGKQVFDIITEKKWNFNCTIENRSGANELIMTHSKKIKITKESGATMDSSLKDTTINGIPSAEMMSKILQAHSTPSFTIERHDYPTLCIELLSY